MTLGNMRHLGVRGVWIDDFVGAPDLIEKRTGG
jgi:hypothetical protein